MPVKVEQINEYLFSDTGEDTSAPLNHWQSLSGLPAGDVLPVGSQKVLDSVVVGHIFESLVNNQTTRYHRARLLAAAAALSGDWLHAVPIFVSGLRLRRINKSGCWSQIGL